MAQLSETVTHLLLAGQSFTITGNMGVTSLSVLGTSAVAITVEGNAIIPTASFPLGGGAISLNEDKPALTIVAENGGVLDGITVESTSTGTADIVIQK